MMITQSFSWCGMGSIGKDHLGRGEENWEESSCGIASKREVSYLRTVFQGNNVRRWNRGRCSLLRRFISTMEAGKAVDADGSQPWDTSRSRMTESKPTPKHWWRWDVELPPEKWLGPKNCSVRSPRFGGSVGATNRESMLLVGFIIPDPEGWPSVFFHPELKLFLVLLVVVSCKIRCGSSLVLCVSAHLICR